jgi:hypothetical protein
VFDVEFYEHVQLLVWVKFSQKSKLKLKFWKWNDSKRFQLLEMKKDQQFFVIINI